MAEIVPFFVDDFTCPIALGVGCIVGGFGLIATLFGGARRDGAKSWDGEVIDKKFTEHNTENRNGGMDTHYFHIIEFRLASGGRKKMKQCRHTGALNEWDMMVYLNIGDKCVTTAIWITSRSTKNPATQRFPAPTAANM